MAISRKKDSKISFDQMLDTSTVSVADAKKKTTFKPEIKLTADLAKNLHRYLEQKKIEKEAANLKKAEEQPIIDFCFEQADKNAFDGNFAGTYKIVGDGESIQFITTDRFTVTNDPENLKLARQELGNLFDECTEVKKTVVLKQEVFENEDLKKELASLLGDKFGKFFEVQQQFIAKSGLKENIYKIAGNKDKLNQIRNYITQAKPSLK